MNVGMNDSVSLDAKMLQSWLDGEGRTAAEGQKMQFLSREMQARNFGQVNGGAHNPDEIRDVVAGLPTNDKNANGCARRSFLAFVLRECGNVARKEDLPPVVKTAMKLNSGWLHQRQDWNEGKNRPLTVRRIKAVMTAIYAHRAGVEGWNSDSKVCKDFWNGLSSELRAKLRQQENANLFRDLFRCYSESNAAERKVLLSAAAFADQNNVANWQDHLEELKNFWNGLCPEFKCVARQPKNLEVLKKLFENFCTPDKAGDNEDFLQGINKIYRSGLKSGLANPIPLGHFKTAGTGMQNDQIGQCIMNQLSSTEYIPSLSEMEDGAGGFEKALRSFNREGGSLTINYKMKKTGGTSVDESITLIGGTSNTAHLKIKTEGGKEITVTRNGGRGTLSYAQLEKKLEKIIGLTGNKLYALLNKTSSGGLTSYGVAENQDYQKAFLVKNRLPNGTYTGDVKYTGTLTVRPKQGNSNEHKFVFQLSVEGDVRSANLEDGTSISYGTRDPGNPQSLTCTCEYNVSDNANEFKVSNLTYNMAMNMHRIVQIESDGISA